MPLPSHDEIQVRMDTALNVFSSLACNSQQQPPLLPPDTWLSSACSEGKKMLTSCNSTSPWTENVAPGANLTTSFLPAIHTYSFQHVTVVSAECTQIGDAKRSSQGDPLQYGVAYQLFD